MSWLIPGRRCPRVAAAAFGGVWTPGGYAARRAANQGFAPDPEHAGRCPATMRLEHFVRFCTILIDDFLRGDCARSSGTLGFAFDAHERGVSV